MFFISYATENPGFYISWICIIAFSICVHEYAHAAVAYRLSDDTAARLGHLTLNPLVQMGPMSLVALAVIGFAWGLTPIDERNLRDAWQRALVSAAGPLSNLLLCAVFALAGALAMRFGAGYRADSIVLRFFSIGSMANGVLFVLNILPAPPLDGWNIASQYIAPLRRLSSQTVSTLSWVLLLAIFLTPLFQFIWFGGGGLANLLEGFFQALLGV